MRSDIVISTGANKMAQLIVRNLEDDVKRRLQRRATRHRRSVEEEVRDILRNAVRDESRGTDALGTRIARRFAGHGIDFEIPEFRGEQARPASFEE
jgi:plasmid stability protein